MYVQTLDGRRGRVLELHPSGFAAVLLELRELRRLRTGGAVLELSEEWHPLGSVRPA